MSKLELALATACIVEGVCLLLCVAVIKLTPMFEPGETRATLQQAAMDAMTERLEDTTNQLNIEVAERVRIARLINDLLNLLEGSAIRAQHSHGRIVDAINLLKGWQSP